MFLILAVAISNHSLQEFCLCMFYSPCKGKFLLCRFIFLENLRECPQAVRMEHGKPSKEQIIRTHIHGKEGSHGRRLHGAAHLPDGVLRFLGRSFYELSAANRTRKTSAAKKYGRPKPPGMQWKFFFLHDAARADVARAPIGAVQRRDGNALARRSIDEVALSEIDPECKVTAFF